MEHPRLWCACVYATHLSSTIFHCLKDPVTGLFPAFLLSDGTTTSDAWVRDNTYTVMCLWALSIAYKKQHEVKENTARAVELEQVEMDNCL